MDAGRGGRSEDRTRRKPPQDSGRPGDLLIVLLAAILPRLLHLIEFSRLPFFSVLQMDAKYHAEWARRLLEQGWNDPEPFFRAPLYPYWLAVVRSLTGDLLWSARIVQVALGVVTVALAYAMARRLLPRGWALAVGILAAWTWTPIHYETELLLESFFTFFTTLLLYRMVVAEKPGRVEIGIWGLLAGLAAATRPNILLFLPAVPLFVALRRASGSRRQEKLQPDEAAGSGEPPLSALLRSSLKHLPAALVPFLVGFLIPVLPVWAHNARQGDPATVLAWQGGINFYIGNNPSANGWSAVAPGMRTDWKGGYEDALRLARERSGRALKPSEVSSFWTSEGMKFWAAQPGAALRLLGLKSLLFWANTEIRNNEDPRFYRHTAPGQRRLTSCMHLKFYFMLDFCIMPRYCQ